MAMTDMTMSAEEAKEYTQPTEADAPKYPWGLRITLNDDSLEKLGITSLPSVGTKMQFTAVAEVCGSNQYQDQKGESESLLELQITGMELGSAQSSDNAATLLYNGDGN